MKCPLYSFLLTLVVAVRYGQCAHLRASGANTIALYRERNLFKTITTSDCGNIHQEPFQGKLTLTYEYIVETVQGGALDVATIENALVQAVVSSLSACDYYLDRPMYAIELTASHQVASQGLCDPAKEENVCYVITGDTTILLDSDVSGAKAQAYDAIVAGLADQAFLTEFAPDVASAHFSRRVRDTFAMIPPTSPKADGSQIQPVTSAIAVAAASVSFLLVSIFVFGTLRRRAQRQPEHELDSTHIVKTPNLGIKRAKYHQGDPEPSLFHLSINRQTPSTTWSVSDLTSEGSTRSGFSRTTSTLEKIEEEEELFEDVDQHSNKNEKIHDNSSSPQHSRPSKGNGSHCIETFDAIDRRNTSEDNGPHESMLSMLTLEEEPDVVDLRSDLNKQIHENSPSPQHSQPSRGSGSHCIETFDAIDRRNTSEDNCRHESMLSILPLEESLEEVQFQDDDPHDPSPQHRQPSRGSGSRSIEAFDVVDIPNASEGNGTDESMLSILTLFLSRQDNEEQDAHVISPEEMTTEEAEQMLIDILSPISANSSIWIHDTEAIVAMEKEAPEPNIPTQSAFDEKATPSSGDKGDAILGTGEKDFNVSEQPAPAEHSPSMTDCSVAKSEEPTIAKESFGTNAVPISTGHKDKPTVLFEDMTSTEPPKQPVAKNENSMEDNSVTTSEDEVVTRANDDAGVGQTGIAGASIVGDPIGTNLDGGEVSIDDSLALSAYTTDSEWSIDGWLSRFLFELSVSEKLLRITAEPIIPE